MTQLVHHVLEKPHAGAERRHAPNPPRGRATTARPANNVAVDARGRTTLEQMTEWLHGRWS